MGVKCTEIVYLQSTPPNKTVLSHWMGEGNFPFGQYVLCVHAEVVNVREENRKCYCVCVCVYQWSSRHIHAHTGGDSCAEFGRYVVFLIYYRYHVSVATFSLQHLQMIDGKISKIRKNVMNFQSFIEYIYEYNHCLHCCAAAGEYPDLSTRGRHTLRWFSFY